MFKKLIARWAAPLLVILVLLAVPVLGAFADPGAPTITRTPRPSAASDGATKPFGESPSDLAPSLVRGGDETETVNGAERGRTTTFGDTEYDPGPRRVVTWFRVQEPNSGLKPVWEGKGWWLGAPEKKTAQIGGAPVTLEYNVDAGTFEGKPFRETWLKGSWTKDGKEYQMLAINVTVDDFVKMANSVE